MPETFPDGATTLTNSAAKVTGNSSNRRPRTSTVQNAANYWIKRVDPDNGTGAILREFWYGITGKTLADLTGTPRYPAYPSGRDELVKLEVPTSFGASYGTRIRGYFHPPATGNYYFAIASGDAGELKLSTDENPANAATIASVANGTAQYIWDTEPSQKSAAKPLVAGNRYFIEVVHKADAVAPNHVAVAANTTGAFSNGSSADVIPGAQLSPIVVITDAALQPDERNVVLTTSPLASWASTGLITYALSASGAIPTWARFSFASSMRWGKSTLSRTLPGAAPICTILPPATPTSAW
jgi:hypothetical protein